MRFLTALSPSGLSPADGTPREDGTQCRATGSVNPALLFMSAWSAGSGPQLKWVSWRRYKLSSGGGCGSQPLWALCECRKWGEWFCWIAGNRWRWRRRWVKVMQGWRLQKSWEVDREKLQYAKKDARWLMASDQSGFCLGKVEAIQMLGHYEMDLHFMLHLDLISRWYTDAKLLN